MCVMRSETGGEKNAVKLPMKPSVMLQLHVQTGFTFRLKLCVAANMTVCVCVYPGLCVMSGLTDGYSSGDSH